jgi:hypothetical protein
MQEVPMRRRSIVLAMLLAWSGPVLAQSAGPAPGDGIPYPTVAAALNALKAKPGVKFSSSDGWTVADDTDGAIWSFTPASHYANPSVGRRTLRERDGRFFVETRILCQAQKPACDRLRNDYALLDQRMNEAVQRDLQKKK